MTDNEIDELGWEIPESVDSFLENVKGDVDDDDFQMYVYDELDYIMNKCYEHNGSDFYYELEDYFMRLYEVKKRNLIIDSI